MMDSFWSSKLTGTSLVLLLLNSSFDLDGIASMIANSIHENDYRVYLFILTGVAVVVTSSIDLSEQLAGNGIQGKVADSVEDDVKKDDKKLQIAETKRKEVEEMELALIDYRRVCAERENTLGKNHPNTATQYNNIGALLDKLGDVDGALKEFIKARDAFETSCGRGHPLTATAYNNIGGILRKQGHLEGALTEYFKVLSVQEKVLGKYHKETAQTLNNIGVIQFKLGDSGALKIFEKSLKIYTEILGPNHPKTEQTKQAIAFTLKGAD
jgi:tetratricopeptide (TPR) repeat protein